MPSEYFGMLLILALSGGVALLLPVISRAIGPYRPNKHTDKLVPYESGQDPVGTARDRFSVKFYMVAMLFILFDIEVVFMYPWAVQYTQLIGKLGIVPLVSMAGFIGALGVGLVYLFKKKGLEWS